MALFVIAAAQAAPAGLNATVGHPFGLRPGAALGSGNTYVKTTQVGTYPEGFSEEDYDGAEGVISGHAATLNIAGNVRAYWTKDWNQHSWSSTKYKKLNLLGKSLRFTADYTKVGCACNAAIYMVAMGDGGYGDSSGYCDIQGVGGRTCTEIDVLEGNRKAIQTTLHTQTGKASDGTCNQYGCAVNWGKDSQAQYGTGSTVDSSRPYEVDAAFDEDGHMTVRILQDGKWHTLWDVNTAGNGRTGVPEDASRVVKTGMQQGMVLAISLWEASDNMAWLNGDCNGHYPHCDLGSTTLAFSNIRVLGDTPPSPVAASPPPPPPSPPSPPHPPYPPPATTCTTNSNMQCQGNDIRDAGWVASASACCAACLAVDGCKAWTWNRGYDQKCWIKSSCDRHTYDNNCDSGFTTAPPGDTCSVQTNTQCKGDDIRDAGYEASAGACCDVCRATAGCKAWTWNRGYDQHCWVKSGCSSQGYDNNCDSGVVNTALVEESVA